MQWIKADDTKNTLKAPLFFMINDSFRCVFQVTKSAFRENVFGFKNS